MISHSNGALVVREFARRYPQRTEALVLVDGSLRNTLQGGVVAWMREMLAGERFEDMRKMMAEQTPREGLSDDDWRRIAAGALRTPRVVHLGGLDAMTDPATWHEDPITVPMLAVMAKSPRLGAGYEPFLRRFATRLEYHEWDGVGHAIQMERAEAFDALLSEFVRRLPGAR